MLRWQRSDKSPIHPPIVIIHLGIVYRKKEVHTTYAPIHSKFLPLQCYERKKVITCYGYITNEQEGIHKKLCETRSFGLTIVFAKPVERLNWYLNREQLQERCAVTFSKACIYCIQSEDDHVFIYLFLRYSAFNCYKFNFIFYCIVLIFCNSHLSLPLR